MFIGSKSHEHNYAGCCFPTCAAIKERSIILFLSQYIQQKKISQIWMSYFPRWTADGLRCQKKRLHLKCELHAFLLLPEEILFPKIERKRGRERQRKGKDGRGRRRGKRWQWWWREDKGRAAGCQSTLHSSLRLNIILVFLNSLRAYHFICLLISAAPCVIMKWMRAFINVWCVVPYFEMDRHNSFNWN